VFLKGNIEVSDKFRQVPEKKAKPLLRRAIPQGASPKGEEALKERLAHLGY